MSSGPMIVTLVIEAIVCIYQAWRGHIVWFTA